jgi:hypothetical protein
MGDLIIITEMLKTVMNSEDLRERVLDVLDLSDEEATRVVDEFILNNLESDSSNR